MRAADLFALAFGALRAHRVRTRLTYAAIAIGVGAVLVLTAVGEAGRLWIIGRFSVLGSNVLITAPGRTETRGGAPLAPATTRDLTLEDVEAIERGLTEAYRVIPLVVGEALATHGGRGRRSTVVGSTREFLRMRHVPTESGVELPPLDLRSTQRVCVIGRTLRRELFGDGNCLGADLRVGESSFRIIGVIAQRGQSLMINMDEIVLIPTAGAMALFNRTGLFRIFVQVVSTVDLAQSQERLEAILRERHDGEEDFTVLTPGAVASALGNIVAIVAAALAAIGAVSLLVAGVGVMNVMIVSVTERAAEIGLMKSVGAANGQVLLIFLAEAVLLSLAGGMLGVAGGFAVARGARALLPGIPFEVPPWAAWSALAVSASVGLAFGILPALRAARLEPIEALRGRF